jgi:hypothetical protein
MADEPTISGGPESAKDLPDFGTTNRVMPRSPLDRPLVDERVSAEETKSMRDKGRPRSGTERS